jgi:hypothetical protein
MLRTAFAAVLAVALFASVACAADLPAGTWTVNVDGKKGKLVVGEVGKDKKVKLNLFGTDIVGTWEDDTLTFTDGDAAYEAHLVSEQLPKGGRDRLMYTLTGVRRDTGVEAPPGGKGRKSGWYARVLADAPVVTGEIKAEIRGVLVYDANNSAYVSVKRKTPNGVDETRIWVNATEEEWKLLNGKLQELNGKEVIVVAPIAQMKGAIGSVPDSAMYFLGAFEPRLANVPKRDPK